MKEKLGFFGEKDWIDSIKASYCSPEREFIDVLINHDDREISFPLVVERFRLSSGRTLEVARHAGIYMSDYLEFDDADLIVRRDFEKISVELKTKGVDMLWLSNLPVMSQLHSSLSDYVKEAPASRFFIDCVPTLGVVCLDSFDSYLDSLSKNTRRNIKRKNKALEETGAQYSFREAGFDNFGVLLRMQESRAKSVGMDAISQDLKMLRVLIDMVNRQKLFLSEIAVDSKPISILLVIQHGQTLAIYMQGFDEDWQKYSPSYCNLSRLIEFAHNHGYAYVDFLRGEEKYKRHFINTRIEMQKFVEILTPGLNPQEISNFVNHYEE